MSLSQWHDSVAAGHVVIVYEGINRLTHIVATRGKTYCNRYGAFHHDDIIGKRYGTRWESRTEQKSGRRRNGASRKGFVYILHPTPELWTYALRHRTQIIYTPDISAIVMQLGLRPGSVVIETGTGSGSLTASLARAVMPHGHVHSFEYHDERVQRAREDFKILGIDQFVTVYLRNTMEDGFMEELDNKVDAVFLDLPGPWEVIAAAARSLKEAGTFCGFSPCIEQVQRTCNALRDAGFHSVQCMEIRHTNFESKATAFEKPNFGNLGESVSEILPTEKSDGDQTNWGQEGVQPAAKRQRIEGDGNVDSSQIGVAQREISPTEASMAKRPASNQQLGYLRVILLAHFCMVASVVIC